jgi:nitroimidazol reductase NimA-like FMN-containing flavoprotein (pyridoxamine 5'-phosphate oxidase superfamily)
VNYAIGDDEVLIRTAPGTKLDAAARGQQVAFEIDHADAMYHTGWSVLVQGRCEEVTDPERLAEIERLPLRPWAQGEKDHVISIRAESVTGRRLVHVASGD